MTRPLRVRLPCNSRVISGGSAPEHIGFEKLYISKLSFCQKLQSLAESMPHCCALHLRTAFEHIKMLKKSPHTCGSWAKTREPFVNDSLVMQCPESLAARRRNRTSLLNRSNRSGDALPVIRGGKNHPPTPAPDGIAQNRQ